MAFGEVEPKWTSLPRHRSWLRERAGDLFDFFDPASIDPDGGFCVLDDRGRPIVRDSAGNAPPREIYVATRLVHCFAIARLLGRPGAERFIDHGMDFLWNAHRDVVHGGYVWSVGKDGPGDDRKQAYGHAFVLLAASSARVAGHPDADRLLADVSEVLRAHFWQQGEGAAAEEFERDWTPIGAYRGQNANMHLTEACMAAFEATDDRSWLAWAESIATLIIRRHAGALGWRVPEHFTATWDVDRDYDGSPVFRPHGYTPGHWLEWTRLPLQLWETGGRRADWMPDAARALFANAVADGWDRERGGFFYTLDWQSRPRLRQRLFWPLAEGVGAAHSLNAIFGEPQYEEWYRRIWDFIAVHLIDRERGGWLSQIRDPASAPFFEGKPDLYHDHRPA
jgi:sulfoquinovose isomerase